MQSNHPPIFDYYCSNRFKLTTKTARSLKCAGMSSEWLSVSLKEAIKFIDGILEKLTSSSSEEFFDHYREGLVVSRLAWPKAFTVLSYKDIEVVQAGPTNIDDDLDFLASLNASNNLALSEVEAGKPLVDKMVYLLDPVVGPGLIKKSVSNVGSIFSVALVEALHCDVCSVIREKSEMEKHKFHPECIIEADKQRMAKAGYIKLENIEEVIAVRGAAIEHELISTFWSAYVPPWVEEAIQTFRKSGGDFAGMTLADFLRAMKPEAKP